MGDPITGKGVEFRRWNAGPPGAWEEIAQVKNIGGPSMTRDTIDVTVLGSTGGYREFIAGFRSPGTLTFTLLFTRDAYETMKNDFESDDRQNYEIVLPDADNTTFEFEGLVTELPLTIPPDDVITADVTIQISGQVAMNSGSGPSPG